MKAKTIALFACAIFVVAGVIAAFVFAIDHAPKPEFANGTIVQMRLGNRTGMVIDRGFNGYVVVRFEGQLEAIAVRKFELQPFTNTAKLEKP